MSSIKPRVFSLTFDLSLAEGIDSSPISRPRMRRVILASLAANEKQVRFGACINLRLCNLAEARALNRTHRDKGYAPNVLTFEYPRLPRQPVQSDIAICMPVVRKEARQQGKLLDHHFMHLLVHGCLHALGYDHVDDAQAEAMEALERQILKRFRISDPYLSSATHARTHPAQALLR
jgi:probable rRNA maturation factor